MAGKGTVREADVITQYISRRGAPLSMMIIVVNRQC